MTDRHITLKSNADMSALRAKMNDPVFVKALANNPEHELKKFGVQVDKHTAKAITDHLNILPGGSNPAALAVSVVVSAVL